MKGGGKCDLQYLKKEIKCRRKTEQLKTYKDGKQLNMYLQFSEALDQLLNSKVKIYLLFQYRVI